MANINNPLYSTVIKSTVNNIRERGATSLSDALKSNTTLTKFNLRGKHKRNDTNGIHQQFILFLFLIKPTDNKIGKRGTASLCDALKSNTTLTVLNLEGEDKRNNTQMTSINNPPFPFSSNQQTTALDSEEEYHWETH